MLIRIAWALIGVILYLAIGIIVSVVAVLWKGFDSEDAAPWIVMWPSVVILLIVWACVWLHDKLTKLLDWIIKKVRKS